jgi:cytochrome c oxidase assembly protein subunit 15
MAGAYLTWKETPRFSWMRPAALAGVLLLLVQAVLGGVTVLLRLPDAVSTSHLGLAFLFLALATVLAVASGKGWHKAAGTLEPARTRIRMAALVGALLTFSQSLVGAAVRHTDAGMACPDVPLCLGRWIPPFQESLVALHFTHRVLGVLVLGVVLWVGHLAFRGSSVARVKTLGVLVTILVASQVLLGFLSVYFRLAVVPVSLHTLLAALLLTGLVALTSLSWGRESREGTYE